MMPGGDGQGGDDLRVSETPITFVDRTSGASKMSTKQILTHLRLSARALPA